MALFLLLIILLAIAWGVADFQLQSRIERPPPSPVPKAAAAASRNVDVVPPTESAEPAAVAEPAIPQQDPRTATPEADKTPQ